VKGLGDDTATVVEGFLIRLFRELCSSIFLGGPGSTVYLYFLN